MNSENIAKQKMEQTNMLEPTEPFAFLVCLQSNGLITLTYNNSGFNDIDFVIKVTYMVWVDE